MLFHRLTLVGIIAILLSACATAAPVADQTTPPATSGTTANSSTNTVATSAAATDMSAPTTAATDMSAPTTAATDMSAPTTAATAPSLPTPQLAPAGTICDNAYYPLRVGAHWSYVTTGTGSPLTHDQSVQAVSASANGATAVLVSTFQGVTVNNQVFCSAQGLQLGQYGNSVTSNRVGGVNVQLT